ncbi:MAG: Ldh family oxidoreductase [Pseudomonadota bacterium]
MTETLSLSDLEALSRDCLTRAGVPARVAQPVAREVAAAEAAGERDHGLLALLRDLRLIRYGRLIPDAEPFLQQLRPGAVSLDAQHGFAAAALSGVIEDMADLALTQGVAMVRLDRASAPGAMIRPITRLAEDGFLTLAFGRDGPGRFARPDHPVATPLRQTPASPLATLLGIDTSLIDDGDDPVGGPIAHSAWLWAADPKIAGPSALHADLWHAGDGAQTIPKAQIALPSDLLEQIVTA